jgi:hypothetical protein
MRKLYGAAFALIVLLSVTMSAIALTSKTIYRQNGESAYADWMEMITENLTTDTYLAVTQSDVGTDFYLSICTYDMMGNGSCKYGYRFIQDNILSIDKKLDSASLDAVQIDLYQWNCDENGFCWETPAGTATIQAQWTGTGDIQKGSYKWMSRYNDYMEKGSSSSRSRDATATGSIVIDSDSRDLGPSNYGGLATFHTSSVKTTIPL